MWKVSECGDDFIVADRRPYYCMPIIDEFQFSMKTIIQA